MPSFTINPAPAPRGRSALRLATALVGILVATCTRDVTQPGQSVRLAVAPSFAPGAAPGGSALGVDQVRAQVLRHSTQEVVLDKTYPFGTGSSLQLDLTLPLKQATDTLDLFLDYEHGTQVLFSGSQSAVVGAGASTAPISVLVSYVGPGTKATSLTISPRDTLLTSGDALQLRLTVLDTATPDSVYVGWGSNNAGQAVDPNGRLTASLVRGTVTIRAVSPTPPGLSDSTTVRIVPRPAAMVKVSGDGQTGVSGQALTQPLAVQVNGSDLLGVPGVAVTFSVVSGGGSVDTTVVVTDSLGRAGTGATLGAGTGAQSFKATAGTLSATFGETGGAAPPKVWTGAVSTDWNTAGNWTPSGVPGSSDSVTIPNVTNLPHIHTGSFSVNGVSIQSGAIVTLDTAVLTDLGAFADAGGLLDPHASSTIILAGAGRVVSGNLNVNLASLQGSYALGADIQASNLQVLGTLTLAGHAAVAINTFTTAGSGVIIMTNAADSLVAQGTAAFAGGAETGHLTAGTFVLGGNFAAAATSAFDAGPGHLTVFNGAATQTVTVFDTTKSNQFGSVDFQNPTNVVLSQLTGINGNATLESKAVVTSTDTTFLGGGMALNGGITTIGGSLLRVGRLYVNTTMNFAAATYASTAIILTGNGQAVPAGVSFPFLYVGGGTVTMGAGVTVVNQVAVQGGSLTLTGNFSFPGNTFTQFGGSLILNGHTYSGGGDFTTNNSGVLKMTNALDTLIVGRNAFFQGASESGLLTAGGITFGGNFNEGGGDPQAFVQSGTASSTFINGGSPQTITFGHPGGTGASHFYDLAVGNPQGALGIGSDVFILGHGAFLAGAPKIVSGGGQVVHFANLNITGVIFNDVAIAYDAGLGGNNLIALDTITFENYDVNSATPLISIVSPGNTGSPGTPFLFNNMTFLTDITANGGSGTYINATQTGGSPGALTIDINSGLVVTEGMAHTIMVGGAVVNWAQP